MSFASPRFRFFQLATGELEIITTRARRRCYVRCYSCNFERCGDHITVDDALRILADHLNECDCWSWPTLSREDVPLNVRNRHPRYRHLRPLDVGPTAGGEDWITFGVTTDAWAASEDHQD